MTTRFAFAATAAFVLAISSAVADVPKVYGLGELYRGTVNGADSVRAKIEERAQAQETKTQGSGALLPNISGVGTYYRAGDPSSIRSGYTGNTQKTARITGKETLFHGGSEYAYLKETNRLLEGKEAEVEASRLQYFVDLSTAYYDTLLKAALRNHAKTELELYDEQIGELKGRVRIGRTRRSDLLTVQAQRAGSAARLKAAESAVLESKLALANLARISPDFEIRDEVATRAPLGSLEEYLKASVSHPDLVASRKRRDASEAAIGVERGDHFPDVDLVGNYYLKKEGYTNDSKWDATVTLTVPIFSGGITQSQVRQAASVFRENQIATGQLERSSEMQIRTLHQTLVTSEAELKAFADAVEMAKKGYDQIHRDFKFGLVTNLDLLTSLQTLTDAKRAYDQARYQHVLERVRLEAGAGRNPLAANAG